MRSDTDYIDPVDGWDSIPVTLARLADLIANPITTVQQGFFHFEYRTYPEIALREALLNAFCHRDYRLSGPVMIQQYDSKLEISNLGGFIGGITPTNILHHPPAARNPLLVQALSQLRLVNRNNLGIRRMFRAFISDGKAPPIIAERGDAVTVTFMASEFSMAFRSFVEEESGKGHSLQVDHLLILQHLLRHPEIGTAEAANLCQRNDSEIRETLNWMERSGEYLERGGSKGSTYWTLAPSIHKRLAAPGIPERDHRIDWEAAKTRVLSVLRQRSSKGDKGLSNEEIRQITHFSRQQVVRLMKELIAENSEILAPGRGRYARYVFQGRSHEGQ